MDRVKVKPFDSEVLIRKISAFASEDSGLKTKDPLNEVKISIVSENKNEIEEKIRGEIENQNVFKEHEPINIVVSQPQKSDILESKNLLPRKPPFAKPPRIIITRENEDPPIIITETHPPLPEFEHLTHISRFIMTYYNGRTMSKITTPSGVVLYKGIFPHNFYWEGCTPDPHLKTIEIVEYRSSKVKMELQQRLIPCHSCFEEETNSVDIIGEGERLMARIIQKKTWTNSKILREIIIEPGPYGKSDSYIAHFSWNDPSINFKTTRTGVIVATLMTDCQEKGHELNYVLQFLREIRPRDKAILIAFMAARDSLMADESQTKEILERATVFILILSIIVIISYVFYPF